MLSILQKFSKCIANAMKGNESEATNILSKLDGLFLSVCAKRKR